MFKVKVACLSKSISKSLLVAALGIGVWSVESGAQPVINEVVILKASSGDADDPSRIYGTATKIMISGSGFGGKSRGGPPILWDRVAAYRGIDGQYRYGVEEGDDPYDTGSVVSSADLRQPWEQASYVGLYGKEDNAVYVKEGNDDLAVNTIGTSVVRKALGQRVSDEPAHYVVNGPQGFFGKPREYGGNNPPPGSDYLYVSWWVKQKYDPAMMSNYTLQYGGEGRAFAPGDKFSVEGTTYTGEVLGFPKGDKTYASLQFSSRNLVGSKSLGRKLLKIGSDGGIISGAGAVTAIVNSPYTADGSNKFIRIWDNPDGKNFRFSWTSTQLYAVAIDGSHTDPKTWFTWPGVPERWNHAEVEVDLKREQLRAWVNNKLFANLSLANTARDKNFSPSVALLGWDGQYQYYQLTQFGDIYVDNSLQRIVVSNKPTWAAASVAPVEYSGSGPSPRLKEIQYPISWTDTQIEAEIYVGAYDDCGVDGLFLYVSNQDGVFNENGYKLGGIACPAAPKIL